MALSFQVKRRDNPATDEETALLPELDNNKGFELGVRIDSMMWIFYVGFRNTKILLCWTNRIE